MIPAIGKMLTLADKVDNIKQLRLEIFTHRYLYYHLDTSIIADYEYDKLEKKLRELEKEVFWIQNPLELVGTPPFEMHEKLKAEAIKRGWLK